MGRRKKRKGGGKPGEIFVGSLFILSSFPSSSSSSSSNIFSVDRNKKGWQLRACSV